MRSGPPGWSRVILESLADASVLAACVICPVPAVNCWNPPGQPAGPSEEAKAGTSGAHPSTILAASWTRSCMSTAALPHRRREPSRHHEAGPTPAVQPKTSTTAPASASTLCRPPCARIKGFKVFTRRRVVERPFYWLMHHRRLTGDYATHPTAPKP
jgi:hypothetical protein